MPKVLVVDKVDLVELRITRDPIDPQRRLQVFARYNLMVGDTIAQTRYREITTQLSGARQSNSAGLYDAVLSEIAAMEQV